jgi:hypothetical protein
VGRKSKVTRFPARKLAPLATAWIRCLSNLLFVGGHFGQSEEDHRELLPVYLAVLIVVDALENSFLEVIKVRGIVVLRERAIVVVVWIASSCLCCRGVRHAEECGGSEEERMDEEKKRESEKYVNKWHVEIIPLG